MPRDLATGFLTAGKLSPTRSVPSAISRPEYVGKTAPAKFTGSDVKTADQVAKIRAAGKIAAQAIQLVGEACKPGVTTDELDRIGHEFVVSQGAYPSTLGYRGFPKSLCSSINEVICHGIPDDTVLKDGDIINIDITAFKDGFHGDSNVTFLVGEVSPEVKLLVERTHEAMMRGINAALPGRSVNIIGRAIETYAKRFNYGWSATSPVTALARLSTRAWLSPTTTQRLTSTKRSRWEWCSLLNRCSPSARTSGTCGLMTGPS